jgi:hypothetical protein
VCDPVPARRGLDKTRHARDGRHRSVLQPETHGQKEHGLRVRRAFQRGEELRIDGHEQIAPYQRKVLDHAVVHEHPAPVAERMAVGLLHRRMRCRANMRKKHGRRHGARQLAQVVIVPGRLDAAIAKRHVVRVLVPAQSEAIAIGRRRSESRMQALVDQRMARVEQHCFQGNRIAGIGQPATHGALLVDMEPRIHPIGTRHHRAGPVLLII